MTATTASLRFSRGSGRATASSRRRRGVAPWALVLVATLVLKSFVPLLAALSAAMQGIPVADVCAIYGVRLAPAVDHGAVVSHAMHHMHGGDAAMGSAAATAPEHRPADHADHARDHCALTGLAVATMFAPDLAGAFDWPAAAAHRPASAEAVVRARDASARWLALRLHAPPPRA